MKVTIVVGGRWHAFDLASELHKAGHLHKIITNYPFWYVKKWDIPQEKIASLPLTFWVVKLIYAIGGEPLMMKCQWVVHQWFAKKAVRYLEGSELIHCWSQWAEPSLKWAKKRGIPTVLERSSAHIEEQGRLLNHEYARLGLKWVETHRKIVEMELKEYSLASRIAVPSLFVEKTFLERGFKKEDLYRNALGVNLKNFKPKAKTVENKIEGGFRVIYVGSMSVRKGIHDLIDGFEKANIPSSQLVLVGGKSKDLPKNVGKLPSNIEFISHRPQSELESYYRTAHCFVMSSVEEGMAMVQMQALACGLPLICTTNTGGEDLLRMNNCFGFDRGSGIKEFRAGFMVPIHSPEAIAFCLNEIYSRPGLWYEMRENALDIAENRLDWKEYGKRAIVNYKELLEQ